LKSLYITTPLYYVNAEPHLGHSYTTFVADTVCRYYRGLGVETFFLTGTDEHGNKVAEAACDAGIAPKDYADLISAKFRSTWDQCAIKYNRFIRTTDPDHVHWVRKLLTQVYEQGDIYFGEYGGLYCTGCERFYTEKELTAGKCPDHLTEPVFISEKNYFFRMSRYRERLRLHIEEHPDFIKPIGYRSEVLSILTEPLEDLCISRPKSRLQWGIELPFDQNYVCYVWFDALINYVTALKSLGEEPFSKFWAESQHFIGKDILKPHAIFWPTMLMAFGLPLFKRLNVHGHWIMEEGKMSKSVGNVVRPLEMKEKFGLDPFRYYLMREMVFGQDATFSFDSMIKRLNADLANNLGNLVQRVLAMQEKYFGGIIQPDNHSGLDGLLEECFVKARRSMEVHMEGLAFHRALDAVWQALDHTNRAIAEEAPFKLIKESGQKNRVGGMLKTLLEAIHTAARLLGPFLPEASERILASLGLTGAPERPWGRNCLPGCKTFKPEPLFARIEPGLPPVGVMQG
jgi:methionyl-tRNA synthetase